MKKSCKVVKPHFGFDLIDSPIIMKMLPFVLKFVVVVTSLTFLAIQKNPETEILKECPDKFSAG